MKKISLSILFLLIFSISAQSQVKDQKSINTFIEQQDPFTKLELNIESSASDDKIMDHPLIIDNSSAAQAEDNEDKPKAKTYIMTLAAIGALVTVFVVFLSAGGSSGY